MHALETEYELDGKPGNFAPHRHGEHDHLQGFFPGRLFRRGTSRLLPRRSHGRRRAQLGRFLRRNLPAEPREAGRIFQFRNDKPRLSARRSRFREREPHAPQQRPAGPSGAHKTARERRRRLYLLGNERPHPGKPLRARLIRRRAAPREPLQVWRQGEDAALPERLPHRNRKAGFSPA